MVSRGDIPDSDAPPGEEAESAARRLPLLMLTRNLWVIAAAIGGVIFAGSVLFDLVLLRYKEAPLAIVISNALVALLAAALVFTLLAYGRKQRRQALGRLEALDEVNHHIRNALQTLSFTSAAMKGTPDEKNISEAVARIQWALLEVLPRVEPTYEPLRGSGREAVQRASRRRNHGMR